MLIAGIPANAWDNVKISAKYIATGSSLTDRLFIEAYLIADEDRGDFEISEYELEAKWQLTEQGEYSIDCFFQTFL